MKRIFLAAGLLSMLSASAQENTAKPFTLQGDVSKLSDKFTWIYLSYNVDGQKKLDSIAPKNGQFKLSGTISEPTLVSLTAKTGEKQNFRRNAVGVFVEPGGKVSVVSTDSFSNVKVKGSKAHEEFLKLNAQTKAVNAQMEDMRPAYMAAAKAEDKDALEKLNEKRELLDNELKAINSAYIKANPNSPVALYALKNAVGWEIDPAVAEPLYNQLSDAAKNSFTGKKLNEGIETAKKTAIGAYAMDFTQNDTLGQPVTLSSFRGKYLLIDFWASWCGPCRAENPHVVKAFNEYKDKNFHILGVSLDRSNAKNYWLQAIHDDKLAWTHVSDLGWWKNAVAVQYGINGIPQNFLLDPTGKIIAKNLRGEELAKKLSELIH